MLALAAAGEAAEFNISSSNNQTCLAGSCSCSACTLELRLASARQWFPRAGDLSKRQFVMGLVRRIDSPDLLRQVERLLQPTLSKDFTHSRSSANPSLAQDLSTHSSDRALDKAALRCYISGTWQWFADSRYWIKANYALGLLQMCDAKLLHVIGNLIRTLLLSRIPDSLEAKGVDEDDVISLNESNYTFKTDEHPELQQLAEIWPQYAVVSPATAPKCLLVQSAGHIVNSHRLKSGSVTKNQQLPKWKVVETASSEVEPPVPIIVTSSFMATSGVTNHKDFLRCLPVHLAKYILGFLNDISLKTCMSVSRHWRYLSKEVIRDKLALQCIFDKVVKTQEPTPQNLNIEYAKICNIPVPKVDEKGFTLPKQSFGKKSGLEASYIDIHTDMIQMEERNVYCGPYNIIVVKQKPDRSRVIHYTGGDLIASGSSDRKIKFLDINRSKETSHVMQGHAGSIKALFICEERGFVLSGSYDLSIRRWNLMSGLCMNIYRGHMGVITCLDLHEDKFASAAMDCQAKVWNLEKGKCICSFGHEKPVLSVAISEMSVVSSCEKGLVHVWSIEPPSLVKVLTGHGSPVTCVSFDQWHLVSGSKDGNVMAWSMIGKFSECLLTFRHPQEVLCLHLLYLRVITGCGDGKIRIFDFCNGNCLRVMRANGQGDPVLSLYLAGRRIVINTASNVVLFYFEKIRWDYTAPTAVTKSIISKDKFKMAPLRKQPYSYVRAQRMRRIDSTNEKIYHREEHVAEPGLSHHARFLSARCMRAAQRIQSDSMKILNLREFQKAAHSDLQSELPSKPSSTGWVSRSPELLSRESLRQDAQSRIGYGKRTESLSAASRLLSASEQSTLKRIKKHGLCRPRTPDQIYLTVNAFHNSLRFDETNINTLYNNSVAEDCGWLLGPLEDTGKRLAVTAKKHKVKINIIKEPTDNCNAVKTLIAPFELKEQNPNQKSSFHSLNTKCVATKPMIVRSKSTLGFVGPVQFNRQKNRPQTALEDVAKKTSHITTGSKERNDAKSFLMTSSAVSSLREKLKSQQRINMDPYRNKSSFNLKTAKQQKEYADKVVMEYNFNQKRKDQEKDRASRKAWLKKAEGPELGPNLHK